MGKYMKTYTIHGDRATNFSYAYRVPEEVNDKKHKNIARLCLGKLILHCLKEKGQCYFYAEL